MATANDLNISQPGYVVFDGTATFTGRTLQAGPGIAITNPNGVAGNSVISASGSGPESITGDTGTTVSGAVLLLGSTGSANAGATVVFNGSSATEMDLQLNDANLNMFLGTYAGNKTLSGGTNIGIGPGILPSTLGSLTTGSANILVGSGAAEVLTTGTFNCGMGVLTLGALDSGSFNVALGTNAGLNYTGAESSNILINNKGIIGESNTMRLGDVSPNAGQINTTFIAGIIGNTVSNQEFVTIDSVTGQLGVSAGGGGGLTSLTGDTGVAVSGVANLFANSGSANAGGSVSFNGSSATEMDLSLSDSSGNTYLGALCGNKSLVGVSNTGVGVNAMPSMSGTGNTCLGGNSCFQIANGSYNTTISFNSGYYYTGGESSNILLAAGGVTGDNSTMRLGSDGSGNLQVNKTFIAGGFGVTVTGTALLMDSNGQIGTVVSSERFKDNIEDILDETSILNLRPVEFTYKSNGEKAYGLIAEEVEEAFPDLCVYDKEGKPASIKYHEMPALLLMEIQRLNKRIEKLESVN